MFDRWTRVAVALLLFALPLLAGTAASAADIAGVWQGKLDFGPSGSLRIIATVSQDASGGLTGKLNSPDQSPADIPLDRVRLSGDTFDFSSAALGASYTGKVDAARKRIVGTFSQHGQSFPLTLSKSNSAAPVAPAGTTLTSKQAAIFGGIWEGALSVGGGASLRIVLHIAPAGHGRYAAALDSPDQGANGIPATFTVSGGVLDVKVPSVGGAYHGVMAANHRSISGTWTQNGHSLPLSLKKTDHVAEVRRPQTPQPPFPYRADDVTFPGGAPSVTLAGTLTCPAGNGPFPAVVLISGSGPNDRDETIFGHKPFLLLADTLTRRGIAVLRYDKRGVHQSTGDYATATTGDFAQDALAAVAFLKTRPEIDPARIGVLGHSEGGMIAPICAARSKDVAFAVLMAGPGIPCAQLLEWQIAAIGKTVGEPAREIAASQAIIHKAAALFAAYPTGDTARTKLLAYIRQYALAETKPLRSAAKTVAPSSGAAAGGSSAIAAGIKPLLTPWFRYFLTYDPATALRQVHCPVLALNGSKDLQVDPKSNLAGVATELKAASNPDVTTVEMPGLNHLFQPATTGSVAEYGRIETTIAPAALQRISDWIVAHTQPRSGAPDSHPNTAA